MALYHFSHQGDTPLRRFVWKPNQSGVRDIVQIYQFPEVRINRDQYTAFRLRPFEQSPIPWVGSQMTGFHDVMSGDAEPIGETDARATIYEESHELAN